MSGKDEQRPDVVSQDITHTGLSHSAGNLEERDGFEWALKDESAETRTALVRVAVALTDAEQSALGRALARRFGHAVRLHVEMDSRILGGVWVQVGDTIIDGSLQGRLEALRHHLRTSSRAIVLGSEPSGAPESDEP